MERLYEGSFPVSERRTSEHMRRLAGDGSLIVAAIERDGGFIGFLTWWDFDGFLFGEHFAMLPECRGGGIGGEVIRRFAGNAGKPVLLEAEIPHDDISARRVEFYRRNGFEIMPWPYVQPPYEEGGTPVRMHLMSYGLTADEAMFNRIRDMVHIRVYGVGPDK